MTKRELSVFCNFFENKLVEELYFLESPESRHYGLCSVIGRIKIAKNRYYLANIPLLSLGSSTAVRILLLSENSMRMPRKNQDVEILGNLVLVNGDDIVASQAAENRLQQTECCDVYICSARDKSSTVFAENVVEASMAHKQPKADQVFLNGDHKHPEVGIVPAIRVHSWRAIENSAELIECNLSLRTIQKKKWVFLRDSSFVS